MYEKEKVVYGEKLRGKVYGCSRFETRKVIVRNENGKNCETVIAMFEYSKNSELLKRIEFHELEISDEASIEILHFAGAFYGIEREDEIYKEEGRRLFCMVKDGENRYDGILKCSVYERYMPYKNGVPYYVPASYAKLKFFESNRFEEEAEKLLYSNLNDEDLMKNPLILDYYWCNLGKKYYRVFEKNTGYISHDEKDDLAIGFENDIKKLYTDLRIEEIEHKIFSETYGLGEILNPGGKAYRWRAKIERIQITDHRLEGEEYVDWQKHKKNECHMILELTIPKEQSIFYAGKRKRRVFQFTDCMKIDISNFLRRIDEENAKSQKNWLRSEMMLRVKDLWEGKEVEVFCIFGKDVLGSGKEKYVKGGIFIPEICKVSVAPVKGRFLAETVKMALNEISDELQGGKESEHKR